MADKATIGDAPFALERQGDARHVHAVDRRWWGHRAVQGGHLVALAHTAAGCVLNRPDLRLHHIGMQYFRPAVDDAVDFDVTVEHTGRRIAHTSIRVRSGTTTVAMAAASFAKH